jgi:hypothetical protein
MIFLANTRDSADVSARDSCFYLCAFAQCGGDDIEYGLLRRLDEAPHVLSGPFPLDAGKKTHKETVTPKRNGTDRHAGTGRATRSSEKTYTSQSACRAATTPQKKSLCICFLFSVDSSIDL